MAGICSSGKELEVLADNKLKTSTLTSRKANSNLSYANKGIASRSKEFIISLFLVRPYLEYCV